MNGTKFALPKLRAGKTIEAELGLYEMLYSCSYSQAAVTEKFLVI